MVTILPDPTDDEAAAVLAAINSLFASEERPVSPAAPRESWRESARLLVQDVAPARLPAPAWGNIERIRRIRNRS